MKNRHPSSLFKKFKKHNNNKTTPSSIQSVSTSSSWIPPLQKYFNDDGELQFCTLSVRLYSGNIEQDYKFKFNMQDHASLSTKTVLNAIAERLQIPSTFRHMFSLWISGKDLEFQLNETIDLVQFIPNWNQWMARYTHIPESMNPNHPINRYLISYRREASLPWEEESIAITESDIVCRLLYGEARAHLLNDRFPYSINDICILGGIELQTITDYSTTRYPEFLLNGNKWTGLVPKSLQSQLSPEKWVEKFQDQHKLLKGGSKEEMRIKYLNHAARLPFYGCTFFPCCESIPPAGYFELRLENLVLGVSASRVCLVDKRERNVLFKAPIQFTTLSTTKDTVKIILNDTKRIPAIKRLTSLKKKTSQEQETIHCDIEKIKTKYSKKLISPQIHTLSNLFDYLKYRSSPTASSPIQIDQTYNLFVSENNAPTSPSTSAPRTPTSPVSAYSPVLSPTSTNSNQTGFTSFSQKVGKTAKKMNRKSQIMVANRISIAHHMAMKNMYGNAKIDMIGENLASQQSPV